MGYLAATFLLVLGIHFQKKHGTWACPQSLFCYEWALISFLAALRLYGLYEAEWTTWLIILLGSLSFLIGCNIGKRIKIKSLQDFSQDYWKRKIISERVFWILTCLIALYLVSDLVESLRYLRQGMSLGDIRNASVGADTIEGYTRRTGALWEYISLVVSVAELIVIAFGISEFIRDMRKNHKYIIAVLAISLMRAFAYGGRFGLAYIIVEILACMGLSRFIGSGLTLKMSIQTKRRVRRIVVLISLLIVTITLIRGAETTELLKKYYRYMCGNVVFFDLHLQRMTRQSLWSLTFAGFYGFWAVILPILNRVGIGYPQLYLDTVREIMDGQTYLRIGDGMVTNAFITPFYHLYADFRILGVIMGMALFGMVSGTIYKRAIMARDNYSIVCYLIITQMIFKSLQTYPFTSKTYVLAFFVIWILGKCWRLSPQNSSV